MDTDCNLADGTLADAGVSDHIALLVRFELLDSVYATVCVLALCLVDATVGARGDEAENGILVCYAFAGSVALGAVHAHGISDEDAFVQHRVREHIVGYNAEAELSQGELDRDQTRTNLAAARAGGDHTLVVFLHDDLHDDDHDGRLAR